MQEIKTMMLRVGSVANASEYVFDGPMTDAHIQGYLNRGFKLHTMFPGAVDQSTSSVSVMVVLLRDEEVSVDLQQSQEQINQMVADASEASQDSAWIQPVDKDRVPVRTDSGRFA